MKKPTALLLALTLLASLLAACGGDAPSQAGPSEGSGPVSQSQPSSAPQDGPHTITDMAGRQLELPATVGKVFSAEPIAAIYLYTLAPEHLLGWNYELNALESRYMADEYRSLPSYGMNDAISYEAVIAAGPDIALMVTSLNEKGITAADAMSEKLGIPVAMVSNRLEDSAEAYRFIGALLGKQARAEELAAYIDRCFADIAAASIPEDERVRVYYGNGADSLETAPPGTIHSQIIEMVNGVNVANVELGDSSRVKITLEQVLAWDPGVIIVNGNPKQDLTGSAAAQAILDSGDWAHIAAVQNGRVYGGPKAPFSWVDRPAGPNRVIGLRWLAQLLYPDYYDYDIDAEVRDFYSLFYHTQLTDAQLEELYND